MPDPSAASRPALLHRDHVLHELVNGDLGALVKARRFVCLEVRFIPVQRREDLARAGSRGLCQRLRPFPRALLYDSRGRYDISFGGVLGFNWRDYAGI